jgi:K(+)-stimulated pyrophosphate-energized sodium pump
MFMQVQDSAVLSLGAGIVALAYAFFLSSKIKSHSEGTDRMIEIASHIRTGARAFIASEYKILVVFVLIISLLLGFFIQWGTAVAFVIGAACSMLAGKFGMETATASNSRTANSAREHGLAQALTIAFNGGSVMGLSVCGLGLVGFSLLMLFLDNMIPSLNAGDYKEILSSISGFGLGASSIALFARVGGGIFTKAADVGADLVGKVEAGIPEDDPRNPATIADNVGDNVGDVAGMGADLFESYVGAIIAASTLGWVKLGTPGVILPLVIVAIGVVSSMIGMQFVSTNDDKKIHAALQKGIIVASLLSLAGIWLACTTILVNLDKTLPFVKSNYSAMGVVWAVFSGLIAGFLIGLITEYYTGTEGRPVHSIAKSAITGPATVIIKGIAVGMESTVAPVALICAAIFISYTNAGMYGIAMSAVGMLTTIAITVAIDAYGPIADNAGGIAEMAELPHNVRTITDKLDAVGNTTAAIGKGFAIGSAALTALSLFAAFATATNLQSIDMIKPEVVIGLFVGGILPYLFSAQTMNAVGRSAEAMIEEVRRQFKEKPGIMKGTEKPDYARCVTISTSASLKEMLLPGIIAVIMPILIGRLVGKEALGGMLAGTLVSGVVLAIMMANAGGAWDNAKKFIESGHLKSKDGEVQGKGSEAHKAAVTGDTVGDPFKDTSGPSINIFIKLVSIVSLVCAPLF